MEIKIDRAWKKPGYTISRVYINGVRQDFNCLEDPDRGLTQAMPLSLIRQTKIKGNTAIPQGRYRIAHTYSPKYKRNMPLVCDVPGFEGIRIHSGNSAKDTEGCLLFGKNDRVGWISNSRHYTDVLIKAIVEALARGEKVWIEIG